MWFSTTRTSDCRCGSPESTERLSAAGLSSGASVLRLWNLLRNPIAPTLWCAYQWKQICPMGRKRLLWSERRQSNCCSYFLQLNNSRLENIPSLVLLLHCLVCDYVKAILSTCISSFRGIHTAMTIITAKI